jgi:hypothetical protein
MQVWVKFSSISINSVRTSGAALIGVVLFVPVYVLVKPLAAMLHDPILRWTLSAIMVPSSLLATYPMEDLWKKYQRYSIKQRRIKRLRCLTPSEKRVLGRYLLRDRPTLPWSPTNGTLQALALDHMVYRVASTLGPYVYAIDDYVWAHITDHPGLVTAEPEAPAPPLLLPAPPPPPAPAPACNSPKRRRLKKGERKRKSHALNSSRLAAARKATAK